MYDLSFNPKSILHYIELSNKVAKPNETIPYIILTNVQIKTKIKANAITSKNTQSLYKIISHAKP